MRIQETITNTLKDAIKEKKSLVLINNLRAIKMELLRTRNLKLTDVESIAILINLEKSKSHILQFLLEDSPAYNNISNLVECIKMFLPEDVYNQLEMGTDEMIEWIQMNVDFTDYSNKLKAVAAIKGMLPYANGKIVKESLELLGVLKIPRVLLPF